MTQIAEEIKTFTATEALAAHRRVKLTSGSGTAVEYADQTDSSTWIGTTVEAVAIGANVAVILKGANRTTKAIGADTFAVGAVLYAADDGKVSDSASGNAIGTALAACAAAGEVVEVIYDSGSSAALTASGVGLDSATVGGIPIMIHAELTAAGAEDETIVAAAPRDLLVCRAWMISRDTGAANVTLKNATHAFTAATAKGTADDTVVEFTVIAEYDEIAADAAVIASFSAAGSVDVFLLCVPIAIV